MANGTIALDEPSTIDKLLDTESLTVGANTVQRERVQIAGTAAADIAPVSPTAGLKVDLGADNDVTVTGTVAVSNFPTTQPVSATSLPLPAGAATETTMAARLTESDFDTKTGSLVETAPATDTASSGLNGRLQRIAQRLTSLIGLVPSALSNGFFQVSLKEAISVAVTGTFWQATQPVSGTFWQATQPVSGTVTANLAAGTNNIGDVDVLTLPALPAGANLIGHVDGDTAHDGVDANNPIKVGGKAIAAGLPTAVAGNDRVQALFDVYGRAVMRRFDTFHINHVPAAAAQATIARAAAGAGIKNVCTAITVTLSSAAAPTVGVVTFNLRDGATGAGTIVWTGKLSLPATAGAAASIALTDLWIEGTANTAMTLESAAAPAANVQATVSWSGTVTQ